MTTDLVRVFSVSSQATTTPALRLYVITATKVTRPDMGLQLETVNDHAAQICQRAMDEERSVVVTWEKTKFGRTLMAAHLLKPKEAA